jgi:hypothetical protein
MRREALSQPLPPVTAERASVMRAPENESWVVYLMTVRGMATGVRAVCQQSEWEVMERVRPGHHTLIQSDITTEGAAERAARTGAAAAATATA